MSFKSTDDTTPKHMKRSHSTSSDGVPDPVVEIDLPDEFQQSPSANLMNKPLPPKPTECDSSEKRSSNSQTEEKKDADDEELDENIAHLLGASPQPMRLHRQPKYLEEHGRVTFVFNTAKPECVDVAVHTLLDYTAFGKARQFELINVHGMQREKVLKVHGAVHNKQTLDVLRIDVSEIEKFLRKGQQDDFKGFIVNYAKSGRWFAIRCYDGAWHKLELDLHRSAETYKKKKYNTNDVRELLKGISQEIFICQTRADRAPAPCSDFD